VKNGELYKLLFNNMLNGLAHCEVVYENGHAVDWRYLVVNPAFERLTGLRDVTGQLASRLIPLIHKLDPELLEIYSRVAKTQVSEYFERFVSSLELWFSIMVFSHEAGTFTAVFDVITKQKTLELHLRQEHAALEKAYDETVAGWGTALELRDHVTRGHSERVADLIVALAKRVGVEASELIHYRWGALLHDIGKIGIPDSILLKSGALDDEELLIMRGHTAIGYEMLRHISILQQALKVVLYHHERWNGGGYPFGLLGSDIPLSARLFAVIDVYDAMVSDRPYRKAFPHSVALEHIQAEAGKSFDPQVVEQFVDMVGRG